MPRTTGLLILVAAFLSGCESARTQTASTEEVSASAEALEQISLASEPEEVERLVSKLTSVDRHRLRKERDRFQALDRSRRDALRDLHQEFCTSESGTQLYVTARRYRDWLATIPDGERADLLELPPAQRIARIRELQLEQNFHDRTAELPREDTVKVLRWMRSYLQDHAEQFGRQLPESSRSRLLRMKDSQRRQRMLLMEIAVHSDEIQMPSDFNDQLEQLHSSLSDNGKTWLRNSIDLDEPDAVKVLFSMIADSLKQHFRERLPDRKQLMDFYRNELDQEQRDAVDALPPDQAQRELQRLFIRQRMASQGPPGMNRPPREPPFDRRGPRRRVPPDGPPRGPSRGRDQ